MADKGKTIRKSGGESKRVDTLFAGIRELILSARRSAVRSVGTLQVLMSFEIGRRIVEHEQQGVQRAEYGKLVLKTLSQRLTAEFGKGFSEDNLSLMRKFYSVYRDRKTISETVSGKSLQPATEVFFFFSITTPTNRHGQVLHRVRSLLSDVR